MHCIADLSDAHSCRIPLVQARKIILFLVRFHLQRTFWQVGLGPHIALAALAPACLISTRVLVGRHVAACRREGPEGARRSSEQNSYISCRILMPLLATNQHPLTCRCSWGRGWEMETETGRQMTVWRRRWQRSWRARVRVSCRCHKGIARRLAGSTAPSMRRCTCPNPSAGCTSSRQVG